MNERFLSRWSRRKHDSRRGEESAEPEPSRASAPDDAGAGQQLRDEASPPASAPTASARSPETTAPDAAPPQSTKQATTPELPPIESLTPESDFRAFMQPGVDGATRNAALAQLFRDPRYNVMDGLDVYIDDYTQADPIPSSMLARLKQLHTIGLSDEEIERRDVQEPLDASVPSAGEVREALSAPQAADSASGNAADVAEATGPADAADAAGAGDGAITENTKPQETQG